jgi:nondiscriminating glutamyl-tRNA synthetase
MDKNNKIRVRIAPSPTGLFHIGTARTALFNYLFAKKNKGSFILRIEDTDKERSEKKFEKDIMDGLEWLGLKWNELYYQSERVKTHENYLKKLLDSGQAYKKEIIWFKNPNKQVVFHDLIRGRVEVDSSVLGDFSLAKDLKTPLYNFAAVIDDHEMAISHVIRGEDHISNTPKQILVYEALGWEPPQFAHLPLILGPDRSKLSKRHGATSLTDYKNQGYLPEALVNFMVLLGWSPQSANLPDQEIFSLEELTKEFSLEKIQKGGAIFNLEKLDWFNSHYIRSFDLNKLTELCIPYLIAKKMIKPSFKMKQDPPAYGAYFLEQKYIVIESKKEISADKIKQIINLEKERIHKLSEVGEMTEFFFKTPKYKADLLLWREAKKPEISKSVELLESILCDVKEIDFTADKLKYLLMPEAEKFGSGDRGKLLWPLRVALSGREKSPGPFEIAEILGKEETLKRITQAKKLLKK